MENRHYPGVTVNIYDKQYQITNDQTKYELYRMIGSLKEESRFLLDEIDKMKLAFGLRLSVTVDRLIKEIQHKLEINKRKIENHHYKIEHEFNPWLLRQDEKIASIAQELEHLMEKLNSSEHTNTKNFTEQNKIIALLEQEKIRLISQIQQKHQNIEKHREDYILLDKAMNNQKTLLSECEQTIVRYDAEIKNLEQRKGLLLSYISLMGTVNRGMSPEAQLKISKPGISKLEEDRKSFDQRIKVLKTDFQKQNKMKVEIEKLIKEYDQCIYQSCQNRLKEENALQELIKQHDDLVTAVNEKEKCNQDMVNTHAILADKIDVLNRYKTNLEKEKVGIQSDINNYIEQIQNESKNLNQKRKEINDKTAKIDLITRTLDQKISFSAGSYIDVDDLKNELIKLNLQPCIVFNLLSYCHWQQMNVSIEQVASVLVNFYNTATSNNIKVESYLLEFNKFLIKNAVPIENKIALKDLVELRVSDSLARFIQFYLKFYLKMSDFKSVIAVTIWKNQVRVATSDTTREDFKNRCYINIKKAIKYLTDVIKCCQSDDVETQKKYIKNLFFALSIHHLDSQSFFPKRMYTDLLNILQFQSNQKNFSQQLQAIDKNIYIYRTDSIDNILHAGFTILKDIICDHLISACAEGHDLSLLPTESILLGTTRLDCGPCSVLIDAINTHLNGQIVLTGTHHIDFEQQNSSITRKFFNKIEEAMNERYKKNQLSHQDYTRILQYLIQTQKLINDAISASEKNKFCHVTLFKPNRNNKTFSEKLHETIPRTQYSAVSPHSSQWLFGSNHYQNDKNDFSPTVNPEDNEREKNGKRFKKNYN